MRLSHLRALAGGDTSPRRGEVGSRLRDPGEGDPLFGLIRGPLTRNGRVRRARSDLSPTGRGEEPLRQSRGTH
jgi:hypothetical protein